MFIIKLKFTLPNLYFSDNELSKHSVLPADILYKCKFFLFLQNYRVYCLILYLSNILAVPRIYV